MTWQQTRPSALGWAVLLPLAVAAGLSLVRPWAANTSMALILVLVVVAVAVRGDRLEGVVAAVVAAACFDFFLTAPYYHFTIRSPRDVETAALLLVVGIVVNELAQWGHRELERASAREGYLVGLTTAARMASDGAGSADLVSTVGRMITEVLDLDDCRFTTEPSRPDRPQLHPDGAVTWRGGPVDVDRDGLPTMDVVELPARRGDGLFLLTAATRVRRPSLEQRQIAASLAEQIGAAHPLP
ncbi:PAS domain-containing sensor histidine kinase [Pseudonocardia kujensis]|uniref:DUF4118 domain-containing protein n=1 Tax=Pseudonocardia kujensis TaxID=1128675 RepID=UPI001E5B7B71|nr:DUF4118 domain-containing protein [Pseudonocardia kujensis]MCE0763238.1 PAS domain-containing sensor histidine kinase [Pseudonocardia kujensis]